MVEQPLECLFWDDNSVDVQYGPGKELHRLESMTPEREDLSGEIIRFYLSCIKPRVVCAVDKLGE